MSCTVWVLPASPSVSSTLRPSTTAPAARHWSSRLSASRRAPLAMRASRSAPSGVRSMASAFATFSSCCSISWGRMRLKLNRWQRESMVAGTFWISVVARINSRWAGGSSMIFSRALKASRESICTSSMM